MYIEPHPKRASAQAIGLLFTAFLLITACSTTEAPPATDDGLQRVEDAKVDMAYKAPGADFSQYNRVSIDEVEVSFRKNWLRDQNADRRSLSHRISQEDADRIKAALADSFRRIFTEELQRAGYTVVEEVDPKGNNEDLLLLLPAIIDLDVAAPDIPSPGRTRTYTTSAGSMTLGIEFRDSITGDVLGKVMDSRDAPDRGYMQYTNSVTNRAEAERMLRRWAGMLVKALDRAHGK